MLSSHSKVSSPLFKQRFLSISPSLSLPVSLSLALSLPLRTRSSPRRGREGKLNSQTPTRCRRNAKPRRAAEPGSPPRTPGPALGPARSKVGRRRPAGGRAVGSREPPAGAPQPGWASRSPPAPGPLRRLGQAAPATGLRTAGLLPPPRGRAPARGRGEGRGSGEGAWEGGRGGRRARRAVQAPFPSTAVCHGHGHRHAASLIRSSCKSLLAGRSWLGQRMSYRHLIHTLWFCVGPVSFGEPPSLVRFRLRHVEASDAALAAHFASS